MAKFWEFTENLGEYVYVSDVDTYELVYMNKKLREMCGINSLEEIKGKKCYDILQHSAFPCSMCNNCDLQPNKFSEWLFFNPIWNKNLSIKDTLIEEDGRRYRMEIAIHVNPQEWQSYVVKDSKDLTALAVESLRLALKKETPDESIQFFLEYLCKLLKSDRTYIFEKNADGTDSNTYEWCASGVKPMKDTLQNLEPEICENWYKNFSEDKHILIKNVEDIKESVPIQYKDLKRHDITSLVAVPLYDMGNIIGFYGVDNPFGDYSDYAYDVLQMMAHFIVATIKRRDLILNLKLEEQKRTAAILQQEVMQTVAARTQENLDMINDIIGSGMWTVDFDESGNISNVNFSQRFREMLGFTDENDFPNTTESWKNQLHPEDREAQVQAFWDAVNGKTQYDVKYRAMRKDGEYQWFQGRGRVTKYPTGSPRFFIGTFVNITEKRKAQIALEEAYNAANKANAAKTEFLASMSHDIRTPLNAIIGMTAIAAANLGDHEKIQHCLAEITTSSKHLLALVNEVLDMNKIESGKISLNVGAFNLADLIEEFVSVSKPLVKGKKHEFTVNINDIKHENVIGDSDRIHQCLMNFISNAVKYTPEGGKINLSITEMPTNRPKIGCYEFILQDNGIGMSEDFIPKIFDPFVRADDERALKQQGTGLGMPIARNIVRMMNGDIKVESRLNEGTKITATIFLELQDSDEELDVKALADLPVLVADDDQSACESTCYVLNELGMTSEWVLSGKEAVAKVVERHQNKNDFFAAIIDWKMPEMDGLETTRQIRKAVGPDVPIIIISAYDWTDIEDEARKAGADAFIAKPIFKSKVAHTFLELTGKENAETEEAVLNKYREEDYTGVKVLLVEDNEVNAEIAKEILGMTGLVVDIAWNGKEAVDVMNNAADGYYKMIFMDIQMPVMNGHEATLAIRASDREYLKTIPIVAMSANAFAEDVQKSLSVGMQEHIAKPLDFEKLLKVLNKYV